MGLFFLSTHEENYTQPLFLVDFHFYYKMTLRSWFGGIDGNMKTGFMMMLTILFFRDDV